MIRREIDRDVKCDDIECEMANGKCVGQMN